MKTAVGRISPLRNLGQPVLLLLLGATETNEFGGDLGAGAERAQADIAARQFLGHDAHGELAHAGTAEFLRHGQAEDAHFGEVLDDLERDEFVLQVPLMRRFDMVGGKGVELVADDGEEFVVEGRFAEIAVGDERGRGARGPGGYCPGHDQVVGGVEGPTPRRHRGRDRRGARSRPGSSASRP